jgi:hypothetical protein
LRSRDQAGRPAEGSRSPRRDALRRLGLNAVPEINRLAVHAVCVAGGKKRFLDLARTSDHAGVQALIEKYDSLSKSDRSALSITDLCAACGVSFPVLLGQIAAQAFAHNADVSKLLAAVCQPRIVKATIESAIKNLPDGAKDRQMLLAHSNFLPVPKSATTIFRFQQQINNTREDYEPTAMPPFSADIIALNAAQRGNLVPATVATQHLAEEPTAITEADVAENGPGGRKEQIAIGQRSNR